MITPNDKQGTLDHLVKLGFLHADMTVDANDPDYRVTHRGWIAAHYLNQVLDHRDYADDLKAWLGDAS